MASTVPALSFRLPDAEIDAIAAGRHSDPFAVLGQHELKPGWIVFRAIVPGAETLEVIGVDGQPLGPLTRRHDAGVFEGLLAAGPGRIRYWLRATNAGGTWEREDPYGFGPVLGPTDDWLLSEGRHQRLYDKLGAPVMTHEGQWGTHFAVWAPNARRVSVVGLFNDWDGRRHTMRRRLSTGVWEIFIPYVGDGTPYKYEIVGADGTLLPLKADPFGFGAELRPATASVVRDISGFVWSDDAWMAARAEGDPRAKPMTVYEVHLGSWRRGWAGEFLSYDQLADELVPYVAGLGFTHIELLPVSEHPLDDSWGYQPVGLFAPTSRFGTPDGFARFVNRCHEAGIGVLLDWVPAHFPTDAHGLARFDGTALYEHEDSRLGYHPDWNTAIFNFGRTEVSNILIANALFWLEHYHIDGLRVDAVASMLYLDYSRKEGEWLPNKFGGRENLEAVAFLRQLNETVYGQCPGVLMVAEESTSWPGVSRPVYLGGLGFGFKWNMGWMNDTLSYMKREPIHRRFHHNEMTFALMYAFAENFVLPISHDEVVHGKGSLLGKMPGDGWQKFANLRAYLAFMWAHPGKKLLFMGQEFAQGIEWNFRAGLEWQQLGIDLHAGMQRLVGDMNRLLSETGALHEQDCDGRGFRWIQVDDADQSVFAWARFPKEAGDPILVSVTNFTPVPRAGYRLGLPATGFWKEVLNTDAGSYCGSGVGNMGGVIAREERWRDFPASATLTIPPLATVWFVHEP